MSDPNGVEAGVAFLEANKTKEGVITLASGLQYKVLEEGGGLEHPTKTTPCECHYAGRCGQLVELDYRPQGPGQLATCCRPLC